MGNVLVAVDPGGREGTVTRSACALLTLARRLGTPVAVVAGEPDGEAVRVLGAYGAARICWAVTGTAGASGPDGVAADGSASSPKPIPASAADLLVALARSTPPPTAILLPADPHGHDIAARVAVRLDAGLITAATAVRLGPAGPVAVQRCLGETYEVESSVTRGVPVITVMPEAGSPEPAPVTVTPAVEAVAVVDPTASGVEVMDSTRSRRTAHPGSGSGSGSGLGTESDPTPALDQADIVVAGGRGLGSAAAFRLIDDLAAALGGAPAGSHTAAELGWCPRDRRVGLTGRTVRPRLYLASGISGSVRHRAGMQGAETVVAIDTDASAPLLKAADLGVVGDASVVLPALLAEIERRRSGPATWPPVTQPPVTQPPATWPPVTQPPATRPPVTRPPVT